MMEHQSNAGHSPQRQPRLHWDSRRRPRRDLHGDANPDREVDRHDEKCRGPALETLPHVGAAERSSDGSGLRGVEGASTGSAARDGVREMVHERRVPSAARPRLASPSRSRRRRHEAVQAFRIVMSNHSAIRHGRVPSGCCRAAATGAGQTESRSARLASCSSMKWAYALRSRGKKDIVLQTSPAVPDRGIADARRADYDTSRRYATRVAASGRPDPPTRAAARLIDTTTSTHAAQRLADGITTHRRQRRIGTR